MLALAARELQNPFFYIYHERYLSIFRQFLAQQVAECH